MKVWIDYREPQARITKYKEVLGDSCIIDDLGDYGGDWLFYREEENKCLEIRVECKTIDGLLNDISTGRAIDQLHGITQLADIPILVLSGYMAIVGPKDQIRTKVGVRPYSYFYLEHFLHSRENEGVRVYRVPRDGYEPYILKHLLSYYSDPALNISALKPRRHILPVLEKDKRLEVLCSFKNIGLVKAKNLLDDKGSLMGIFTADPKELAGVKDVGKKSVSSLFEQLGRNKDGKYIWVEKDP